jgi:hypothetical protein
MRTIIPNRSEIPKFKIHLKDFSVERPMERWQNGFVTATAVVEEIKQLSPGEQANVIRFAIDLARTRCLAGDELSALAHGFYSN